MVKEKGLLQRGRKLEVRKCLVDLQETHATVRPQLVERRKQEGAWTWQVPPHITSDSSTFLIYPWRFLSLIKKPQNIPKNSYTLNDNGAKGIIKKWKRAFDYGWLNRSYLSALLGACSGNILLLYVKLWSSTSLLFRTDLPKLSWHRKVCSCIRWACCEIQCVIRRLHSPPQNQICFQARIVFQKSWRDDLILLRVHSF